MPLRESLSKPIPVASSRATIGRSPHNTIIVATNTVSRRHVVMIFRKGNYYIKDMDSRNGTYINDEKVTIRGIIDEKQFQRTLLNLVANAVDAIGNRADGEIRISTTAEDARRRVVSVDDNGCSIPPDKQKHIFDLFFTSKGTKGSGLGLPMVNKFSESSGGRLLLTSEKGTGTTFKMVFPLKK